ncbi:MAG: hypothetical protein J5482_02945 [Oscillospiraceae bacterium]|nr:hypothetical protein [Oscillospiraceae bacterium]
MKKLIALAFALLILLTGCARQAYTLEDGRYMLSSAAEDVTAPFLLLHEGKFTVVQEAAISYQPSGNLVRNGNEAILATKYAGEDYTWVFLLTGDNTLRFEPGKSSIPAGRTDWSEDMVFVLAAD